MNGLLKKRFETATLDIAAWQIANSDVMTDVQSHLLKVIKHEIC